MAKMCLVNVIAESLEGADLHYTKFSRDMSSGLSSPSRLRLSRALMTWPHACVPSSRTDRSAGTPTTSMFPAGPGFSALMPSIVPPVNLIGARQ